MNAQRQALLHRGAVFSLLALIMLCLLWEIVLAPASSFPLLVLKVIPLLFTVRGIWRGDLYTMQWSSMLVLLYLAEGAMRAWSDNGLSAAFAWGEILFVISFFMCTILYLRPYKQAAKKRKASLKVSE